MFSEIMMMRATTTFRSHSGWQPALPCTPYSQARTARPPSFSVESKAPAAPPERLFRSHTIVSSRVLDWGTHGSVTTRLGPLGRAKWNQVLVMDQARLGTHLRRGAQDDEEFPPLGVDDTGDHGEPSDEQRPNDDDGLSSTSSSLRSNRHSSRKLIHTGTSLGPLNSKVVPGDPLLGFSRSTSALSAGRTVRSLSPYVDKLAEPLPRPTWTASAGSERSIVSARPRNSMAWQGGRQGGSWTASWG